MYFVSVEERNSWRFLQRHHHVLVAFITTRLL